MQLGMGPHPLISLDLSVEGEYHYSLTVSHVISGPRHVQERSHAVIYRLDQGGRPPIQPQLECSSLERHCGCCGWRGATRACVLLTSATRGRRAMWITQLFVKEEVRIRLSEWPCPSTSIWDQCEPLPCFEVLFTSSAPSICPTDPFPVICSTFYSIT